MRKKYYCLREQAGQGCDYTIGCGIAIDIIYANSLEEAQKKLISLPETWKEDLVAWIEKEDGDVDDCYNDIICESGLDYVRSDEYGPRMASITLLEVTEEVDMMPILRTKLAEAEAFKDSLLQKVGEEAERAAYEKLKKKFEKKANNV